MTGHEIECFDTGLGVYVVHDGDGGVLGITAEQLRQLAHTNDADRAALLREWRVDVADHEEGRA